MQKNKTGFLFYTKINSKWIEGLNLEHGTVKFLEENISSKFLDINLGNELLVLTPKAKATKQRF